jgi:predicted nucleotidyltransferase
MNMLAEILSSRVRAELFRLLFGISSEELHMRELARQSGCAIGTIQTELKKLGRLDLVTKRKDGNRLYYRANREHPLFRDIQSLVVKTIGLVDVLKVALEKSSDIRIAFVFGSVARHEDRAGSDIDLMVIGSIGLRKLTGLLSGVSGQIGREVNPFVLEVDDFIKRKAQKEHFVTHVLSSSKLFVRGTQHELETLV